MGKKFTTVNKNGVFYYKTYIIIPTCTYDLAQPPNHPTLIPNIFPSESTHSRCLDVGLADTHRQPRYRSPLLTNSCTSATSRRARGGREGVIICTGRYDNISFIIKTHISILYLYIRFSPINKISMEEGSRPAYSTGSTHIKSTVTHLRPRRMSQEHRRIRESSSPSERET